MGTVDMLPAERREMDEELARGRLATATERIECAAEVDRVPKRDRGDEQVEAARAVPLALDAAVADPTEAVA